MKNKIRYVLIESLSEIKNESAFWRFLNQELLKFIGELNYSNVNPRFMGLVDKKRFVIGSDLNGVDILVASLALIKNIDREETAFYTLKTSGTLKALLKDYNTYNNIYKNKASKP